MQVDSVEALGANIDYIATTVDEDERVVSSCQTLHVVSVHPNVGSFASFGNIAQVSALPSVCGKPRTCISG